VTAADHEDYDSGLERAQDAFDAWAYGDRPGPYTRGGPANQCPHCGLFAYGLEHDCETVIAGAFRDLAERLGR
jgi:hypothetical protein